MKATKKLINLLNSYYGIDGGNPKSKYWFVGIEYGESANALSTLPNPSKYNNLPENFWAQYADDYNNGKIKKIRYYEAIRHLMMGIFGKSLTDEELDNNSFLLDLYPIACVDTTHWDRVKAKYTGFTEKGDYYAFCMLYGRKRITEHLQESPKKKTIVCFGNTRWYDFLKLLIHDGFYDSEVKTSNKIAGKVITTIKIKNHKTIQYLVIIPHVSGARGFSHEDCRIIGKYIAKLK